jgi:hypothetical protein
MQAAKRQAPTHLTEIRLLFETQVFRKECGWLMQKGHGGGSKW